MVSRIELSDACFAHAVTISSVVQYLDNILNGVKYFITAFLNSVSCAVVSNRSFSLVFSISLFIFMISLIVLLFNFSSVI